MLAIIIGSCLCNACSWLEKRVKMKQKIFWVNSGSFRIKQSFITPITPYRDIPDYLPSDYSLCHYSLCHYLLCDYSLCHYSLCHYLLCDYSLCHSLCDYAL
ncbi:hypothetical protein EB796_018984 [Bugula neritina]|uniref:Uncharacterized protein n=1 Tax=Bugula neritina TaxID=10212 RepID=A0A7J7JBG2_BUGNE|nr:hypothetical protein EB796_018984 [Bugula neritina]